MKYMPNEISLKSVDVTQNRNIWVNSLKNILFIFSFTAPLIISVAFDLSNFFYGISAFILISFPIFFLFLRVGSDTNLAFQADRLIISSKESTITIPISDVRKIGIVKFSGSRAPFVIKIITENHEVRYLVDKFRFQNPRKKLKRLMGYGEWGKLINSSLND